MMSLLSDAVHLWITPYRDRQLDAQLPRMWGLMTDAERATAQRFAFEDDRRRFVVTRALLRTTLSRYAPVQASDWQFDVNEFGKPAIAHNIHPQQEQFAFNLSHTPGLIALALTLNGPIGIDVENASRPVASARLTARYFMPREAAQLESLRPHSRQRRFFEYWTLKEAYAKARGQGLSIGFDAFSFHFASGGGIEMHSAATFADNGKNWHFWQGIYDDDYLLALCVRRNPARAVLADIVCHRCWPFVAHEPLQLGVMRCSDDAQKQTRALSGA